MSKLDSVLIWLDGKKSTILAIATAVNAYLAAIQIITPDLSALFATIVSILAGSAIYATGKMNERLGRK